MLAGIVLVVGPIGYAASGTVGLGAGLVFGLVTGLVTGLVGGLGTGLVVGLGWGLGTGLGALLRSGLREGFMDFPNLWPYLRLMGRPLLGYTLGYAAIVVWFASVYASLYAVNLHVCGVQHQVIPCNAAFSGIITPHFGDFLFFTVTIFPPIGAYSDLHPLGLWAHAAVAGELIVGVGYTTVVFAAIITYRTRAFDELNTEPTRTEVMITDLKTDLCHAQEQTHTNLSDLDQRMARIERQLEKLTEKHTNADEGTDHRTQHHAEG